MRESNILAAIVLLLSVGLSPQATPAADETRAEAVDGVLYQEEHGPERGYHNLLLRDREFGDLVLEANLRHPPGTTHYGLVFRYADPKHFYRLVLRPRHQDFRVEKVVGQSDYATTRYVGFPMLTNRWYHVRLVVQGPRVEVWIDDKRLYQSDGFSEIATGLAGVTVFDATAAEFDRIRITDADSEETLLQADFDRDDLDAWVVTSPAGVKGQWAVRPKIERVPSRREFVEDRTFRVCPSTGRNQSMFEFPGLTKLTDGQLFTVFIEENQHGTPPWAAMPSSGKLWMARSADMARSWSKPTLFLDTPIDDRHAYTLQLDGGDLLAFFWVQPVAFGLRGLFNYTTRSSDGGLTWTDPVRVRSGRPAWPPPPAVGVRGGLSLTVPPIQLPDGTLAMPIHCLGSDGAPPPEAGLLRSSDQGRTWGDYSTIAFDPQRRISFVEPAVVRLESGKWIAVTRTEVPINPPETHPYKLGPTMTAVSTDEGRTWSPPARLPLEFTHSGSTAPFILQTRTGVVVFAVNTGTAFSYDEGQTWVSQELDCGYYPNLLELAPGTLASIACGMTGRIFRLTKPSPGSNPPPGPRTPLPTLETPPNPTTAAFPPIVPEVRGIFRAIRVRGPRDRHKSPLVAQPPLPLVAVAGATANGADAVLALGCDPDGKPSSLKILAKAPGLSGHPVLFQASGGTIVCLFPVTSEGANTTMLVASHDKGATWTQPARITVEGHSGGLRITSPPVEEPDGLWLVSALMDPDGDLPRLVVLESADDGATWRLAAECPPTPDDPNRLVDPSLASIRDGRWAIAARQVDSDGTGRQIAVIVSADRGKSWTRPRPTGLKGICPEIVELLDGLFLVVAEDENKNLRTAFSWDELEHFVARPLACGYCLRLGGEKHLARGSGVDLAGQFHDLAQVPPEADEINAARTRAKVRIPASDQAFRFKGAWEEVKQEAGEVAYTSVDSVASAELEFHGPVVFLIHNTTSDGRLVGVKIDGREYPPVDMRGPERLDVETCLATDLTPGPHKLTLRPLLRWRTGTMAIRGVDVAGSRE